MSEANNMSGWRKRGGGVKQMTPEETLDWLAQQHFDQCREERPIQEWIRNMKSQLPKEKNT